ncbi:MAG: polymer-forming cytoskeletal protein [Lachnospiraceae bacterium]|nr:polymer-forming cytoskeletal protein [Lachnospiraceae bacterium]
MGFFSDLKEDLSQAVNELMPGEAENTEEISAEKEVDISVEAEKAQLDALLDRVDSIELPEDMDITKLEQEAEVTEAAEETVEETVEEALTVEEPVNIEEEQISVDELPDEPNISGERDISIEEITPEEYSVEEVKEVTAATEEIGKGERKKMDVQLKTATDENAVITAGMTVTGDVTSEGSMEVIGTINGNISILGKLNITGAITGNSKAAEIYADNAKINGEVASEGAVKIGQSSVVIGNIFAKSAVIAGAVKGDIDVHGPVVLDTSAIVMGNIKSKAVQINNGAVIEGMCSQCYADVNPTSFFDEYKKGKK